LKACLKPKQKAATLVENRGYMRTYKGILDINMPRIVRTNNIDDDISSNIL
jgi:hypothetical protein